MRLKIILMISILLGNLFAQQSLRINDQDYFEMQGLNVMVFSDIYPEGHQSGVTIIQHGVRVAANGDVRLEISPGQWSAMPAGGEFIVNREERTISKKLFYPDSSRDYQGFNPFIYAQLTLHYQVKVTALKRNSFKISVDLEEPLPAEWIGKVGFNLELFPGDLFGKTYIMDDQSGIFPPQVNGPVKDYHGSYLAAPLSKGKKLIVVPEQEKQRLEIETKTGLLELWDGRSNHNNGWYIVRSIIPGNVTTGAVEWVVTPSVIPGWQYGPVIHVSQLGYHPDQGKKVIIEQDETDNRQSEVSIYLLTSLGKKLVRKGEAERWGKFLRYNYLTFDFSEITEPGMYFITYRSLSSNPFKIGRDVYDRHAWQPTLEYYLPVQMCHLRVNDHYRVWHGLCHLDDARMAPVHTVHFDGYKQGSSTLANFQSLEYVPGLNAGGWHDAGDYDIRIESQIGTIYMLSMMIEEFGLDYDATTINQEKRLVEIHQPDGKSDALQQIEHGLLTVLGGIRSLGRPYRGIICPDLKQYVLLGDGATMTDNRVYDPSLSVGEMKGDRSGHRDERWVFTEENPDRELLVAAGLAAASRVLKDTNPGLSEECLATAFPLWKRSKANAKWISLKTMALAELLLTTGDPVLIDTLISMKDAIVKDIRHSGWVLGRVIDKIEDERFKEDIAAVVAEYQAKLRMEAIKSPFGIPYRPHIWGAGWTLQRFGVEQYFFYKGWPEHNSHDFFVRVLDFILGVHPGENGSSFVSGVGARSVTVAYGVNRADWSYIPGGVVSGTALIRPDFPELKIWPFLWQQTEYVMGGGATNFMFLVLATAALYGN
jgi:endoglucanase